MPIIQGAVKYENVSFASPNMVPLQLNKSSQLSKGVFVGVVGQSGGKSTLMKLLPRLYELESGRILIDGYDVSKVELYSLRRQIELFCKTHFCLMAPCRRILPSRTGRLSGRIVEAAKIAFAHEFISTQRLQHARWAVPPSLVDSDSCDRRQFTKSAAINPGRSN